VVTDKHAKIEALVKQGKTLAEVKAAVPDSPAPGAAAAPAGGGRGPAAGYTDWTYQELTRK
jgi:hypothetical protein